MPPSLILIGSNKFGAGKDTVGGHLVKRYGYRRYSFGDFLKNESGQALTDPDFRDKVWDLMPETCRDALLACLALGQLDPFAKPTTPEMRVLLQQYGTEFRRAQNENYWVELLNDAIEADKPERAVITDSRFPNEFWWGKHMSGECWYVMRPDDAYAYKQLAKHASEGALEELPHDWKVINDQTIEDLLALVDLRMQSYPPAKVPGGMLLVEAQGNQVHL
jgi:hypothetical protein